MSAVSAQADLAFAWLSLHRKRLRTAGLLVALAIFVTGLFLSLRASPDIFDRISVGPLLLLFFVPLPLGLVISAADFQVMARICNAEVRFWPALQISIYSRAANMLPIPGSLAVRMAALKGYGATFRRGGGLILLFTILWGGIGFCFSALWLGTQAPLVAAAFGLIGVALLAACALAAHRIHLPWALVFSAALLRLGLVTIDALALMLAMRAVGVAAEYHQTGIMVVAGFLASAVPAGIGVRETVIALLSPIAGIEAASGFLAATASRITGMTFLIFCATAGVLASRLDPPSEQ